MPKKVTKDQYEQKLNNKYGAGTYHFITFTGTNSKALVEHRCGYQWETLPYNLFSKERCPSCAGQIPLTLDILNKRNKEKHFIITDKQGSNLKLKCTSYGHTWEGTVENYGYGKHGCPICKGINNARRITHTDKQFKDKLYTVWGDKYKPLDEYQLSSSKIRVLCANCKHIWSIKPNDLLNGHGCPRCTINSIGERIIYNVLKFNKVDFVYHKRYKYENTSYYYDFYLPNQKVIIEYDGLQHYDSTNKYFSESGVARDKIKDAHCIDIGFTMNRIPYTIHTYTDILTNIEKCLGISLDMPPLSYLNRDLYNYEEILSYTATHRRKDVFKKFNISDRKLTRILNLSGYKGYRDFRNR